MMDRLADFRLKEGHLARSWVRTQVGVCSFLGRGSLALDGLDHLPEAFLRGDKMLVAKAQRRRNTAVQVRHKKLKPRSAPADVAEGTRELRDFAQEEGLPMPPPGISEECRGACEVGRGDRDGQ